MKKISQFIEERLFDEKSGYYRKAQAIGKDADFITSPEISQSFGEIIAAYLLQIFSSKIRKVSLVEMGAGRGTLFFDVISTIEKLAQKNNNLAADFLKNCQFHIVEISESLTKIQQEKLQNYAIKWHKNFDDFIAENKDEIFFISNELFDCFAIDQYSKTDIGWCERMIENDQFKLANFSAKTNEFVQNALGDESFKAPFGSSFEYSQKAREFMAKLCKAIKKFGGIAISFDYGYFENEFANTLQAVKNHKKTDIFSKDCDITALVDFKSLVQIAEKEKLQSSLISQREFLTSLGIEDREETLIKNNPEKSTEISSQIQRLIDPEQMGELFKCLIIFK